MKKSKQEIISHEILRNKKLKITPSRVAILDILISQHSPLSVEDIEKALDIDVNTSTIYRTLEVLSLNNVLYQTDFRDGKIYYEYQQSHHHHIVCKKCGKKEGVSLCVESYIPEILKSSKKFNKVEDHMLEFFGVCKKCEIK